MATVKKTYYEIRAFFESISLYNESAEFVYTEDGDFAIEPYETGCEEHYEALQDAKEALHRLADAENLAEVSIAKIPFEKISFYIEKVVDSYLLDEDGAEQWDAEERTTVESVVFNRSDFTEEDYDDMISNSDMEV